MAELTVLFDGGCPLCLREVKTLKRLDGDRQRLAFVVIDDPNYSPDQHQGISYRQAMGRIHAIAGDGQIVTDVAVFRRAYGLVGWGWLYAPTNWPVLGPVVNALYGWWAAQRLQLTRRPSLDQLCDSRCDITRSSAPIN